MNVPTNYDYKLKKEGEHLIIAGIKDKDSALKWINEFSESSLITWRTYKTYPVSRKYQFKKIFRCHFNTCIIRKKVNRNAPMKRYSRNTGCPVTMMFCLSQPKNGETICNVFFKGLHNHDINTPKALLNRPMREDTKKAALNYFDKGHFPSTAFVTHSVLLMAKLGEKFSSVKYDRSVLPDRPKLNLIYSNEKFGPTSEEHKLNNLTSYLKSLNDRGYKAALSKIEDEHIVAMCTPTMLRAHLLPETKQTIALDITDHKDKMNGFSRSYIFTTYTSFGATVPLGIIITETESLEAFQEGIRVFIEDFEIFTHSPQYIMTDGDEKLDLLLGEFFLGSTFLICTYYLLRNMWNWLLSRSKIFPPDARQTLYYQFKRLVFAKTKEEFDELKQDLLISSEGYPQFNDYFKKLNEQRENWAHYFRSNFKFRGYKCNNPTEIAFRLFKDIPLQNVKSFTQPQLVDFVATAFELYYTQKCISGANSSVTLENMHISDEYQQIEDSLHNIFKVFAGQDQFEVDMTVGICTCVTGRYGRLCDHQHSIIHKFDLVSIINSIDDDAKTVLSRLTFSETGNIEEKVKDNTNSYENAINLVQSSVQPNDKVLVTGRKKISQECINEAQNALQEIFAELNQKLLDDPVRMVPAVMKFQSNFKLCSYRNPKIISGLYTAFDEKQIDELRQERRRKRNKKLEKELLEKVKTPQNNLITNNPQNKKSDNISQSIMEKDALCTEKIINGVKLENEKTQNQVISKQSKILPNISTVEQTEESSRFLNTIQLNGNIADNSFKDLEMEQCNISQTMLGSECTNLKLPNNVMNDDSQSKEQVILTLNDSDILDVLSNSSEPVYLIIDENGVPKVIQSSFVL